MPTYNLTASVFEHKISSSRSVEAWGFNESFPGPVIRSKKGELVTVNVTNHLPEPTIIHWHGIQLPSHMDGTEHVQKPILPGETFTYQFIAPDAGTFWYHSHFNETLQLERGMYGAIVVEDENDPIKADADRIFMLDDLKLTESDTWFRGNRISRWIERHDGREGSTVVINGHEKPSLTVPAGHVERWRFINASSARYIDLSLGGRPFRIIAVDGGMLEQPQQKDHMLLTPGERIEILVEHLNEGEEFAIEALRYKRMTMAVKVQKEVFGTVKVTGRKDSRASVPSKLRDIKPLADASHPANRKITFSVNASLAHGIDFMVNGKTHAHDMPVKMGELQVWEIRNASLMDHPFHLHGFFFQVLAVNGKPQEFISWKDTVNLPPRSTVKIAWLPDRAGEWMYHCHILEHHAAGMMGHFHVEP